MKISKKEQEFRALTSSLVPTPVNLLVSQANKKAKKIQDTSGQTLLDLSKSAGPLGLLEKTLVDTLNSVSTPYSKTWRVKVTTQGHLLFQLHPLVHGTKGKESGLSGIETMWRTPTAEGDAGKRGLGKITAKECQEKNRTVTLTRQMRDVHQGNLRSPNHTMYATPNTMDHLPPRSPEGTKKLQEGHRKGRTKPSNLREQVDPATMRMYPTPTVGCEEGGEQSNRVELTPNGSFILRKKNKPDSTFGAKLSDAMLFLEKQKMYPTPTNSEHKYRLKGNSQASKCLEAQARRTGGKLNPNFVEFLMGFPMNWTKVESEGSKD